MGFVRAVVENGKERPHLSQNVGREPVGIIAEDEMHASLAGTTVDLETLLKRRWTHVIVGGGSAGCVLARRLSEHDGRDVLLIEAGGPVDDPVVNAPPDWPLLTGGPFDFSYQSTAQVGLAGRSVPEPRGK